MANPLHRRAQADAIRERAGAPSAPPGFEIVEAMAGMGKTSLVAKVRRVSDGALFAWKLGVSDAAETRVAMREQVERSHEWVRLGVSRSISIWSSDGRTLLQPWVEGDTLRAAMTSSQMLTNAADPRHAALLQMLKRLAAARRFVTGLNAMNLIYDGATWQFVDSDEIREYATASEAWDRQRHDLCRKWTRGPLAEHRADVEAFLAAADAAIDLPRPPFSLRRLWRRLRGR